MGLDTRFVWGGSNFAAALYGADVWLCASGDCAMSKPYEIYRLTPDRGWVMVQIVAETPEGKQQGILDYKREFSYYEARVDHETATTAVIKRRPSC